MDEYIPFIAKDSNYVGEIECNIITQIINFNILILRYIENDNLNYY